ncbi:MAG TPA: ankyrin repeat domain-containing protein [Anaerovoracaceae bacterium]|nr:ankyrin repeat domain-containing protein [Anaerovoracaceae bacterium]
MIDYVEFDTPEDRRKWFENFDESNVNEVDVANGWSRLHRAARIGNFDLTMRLIEAGADVNLQAAPDMPKPLEQALNSVFLCNDGSLPGAKRVLMLLLESGAEPESVEVELGSLYPERQKLVDELLEGFGEKMQLSKTIQEARKVKTRKI